MNKYNYKLVTKELNLQLTENIDVEYNKIFVIYPSSITQKIMNLEYYNDFNWSTNIKKSSVEYNHYKSLNRINDFLNILKTAYEKNIANTDEKYKYNVQIKAVEQKKIFGTEYKKYMQALENMDILKRRDNSKYSAGNFPHTYTMSKELFHSFSYSIIFNMDKDYNINADKETYYTFYEDVKIDPRMITTLNVVKLNKSDAISDEIRNHITNNTTIESLSNRIFNIINFGFKKYLTIGKKVNRLYHHITNLSAIARKHLNIKFNFVDITNCQPLLLAYTMKSNNCEVDAEYINDVENGSFYEQFMLLHANRNQTKVAIYKNLFFGFNTNNETNKLFKKLYPNVWEYLNEINKNKDNSGQTLASILQNIETEIFSDVADVCQNSGYLFTLHDSIYFDNVADEQPVKEHLSNKFSEYGLQVRFNF